MEGTLRRLEEEYHKAEANEDKAKKETTEAKLRLEEAKRYHHHLMTKLQDIELRTRSLRCQLAQQQAMAAKHRHLTSMGCMVLVKEEEAAWLAKDDEARILSLSQTARVRMQSYHVIDQKCLSGSDIYQRVLQARIRVGSLKTCLNSFKHPMNMVETHRKQIDVLQKSNEAFRQQAEQWDESMQSLKERAEAEQQDMRSYRRRNEDNLAKLKTELGCITARNARLNLELSAVEREVCKLRDRMEGKRI